MAILTPDGGKATLCYQVVAGKNPQDKTKTILRGLIVNKETCDTSYVTHYALDNGYITGGQFFDTYGKINGFLEACQSLGKEGRDILLNGWLRIHPELKGQIDPVTRQIGADNELHVCAQCQRNLRRKASDFNWTCVDDNGVRATVQHLQSVGGAKDKAIFAGAKIAVSGTNLTYNSSSDKITASWETTDSETGEVSTHTVELTPESSGYSQMTLPFPEGLASAPLGTKVTFQFFLRQGKTDASVVPATSRAKLVSA